MAGVPFEAVERLSTYGTVEAAREVLIRQTEFQKARSEVEHLLRSRGHGLSEELFRAWRKAMRADAIPPATNFPSRSFATCWESATNLAAANVCLEQSLQHEVAAARTVLFEATQDHLPSYLIFGEGGVRELLHKLLTQSLNFSGQRNARAGDRERHLLLYLQRTCAKNDTLGQFGPTGWGSANSESASLRIVPQSGISKRDGYLERWAVNAAAAAITDDPAARLELSPRLEPNACIAGDQFVFTDTGETVFIDAQTVSILMRCNGKTPAHSLGIEAGVLEELAERKFVRWKMEVPALEPHALDSLMADVSAWRTSTAREYWLGLLEPIAVLPGKFGRETEPASRVEIMDEARRQLNALGAVRKPSQRFLYAAGNPIGEDCFRQCGFEISEAMMDELAREAAPWIDLWRDSYAFIADRVATGLRQLFRTAPVKDSTLPLPAFLRHCEAQKMSLTGPGLVALAHIAFQELKATFRKLLSHREDAPEWTLTADECQFVRSTFDYPKFDEYTFPSADLQISAASIDDVNRGDYEWILAELHPPIALLHHCMYWACPDKSALNRALASTTFGKPNFYYGFFAADFTAHTAVRQFDAIPELTNFVSTGRPNPRWRAIPPSETEVFINEENGDVCLRKRGSHEYLGSFARYWIIPLGFHPFYFDRAPHMPRLRCGKVIVQRRSWTILQDELSGGDFTGISRDLVLAVERLRVQRDLPRYIYIRPTERALRRSGAEGRDKDTKPVFIDLESYLFLEIFHRWLTKAGELEVTEMLPDPDHLLWQEPDGRRTFELRTLIVPRE